jgi:flagellar biosynthesis/type III secretory pathway protein FliH
MRGAVCRLEEGRRAQQDQWRRSAIELAVTLATRLLHDRITSGDYPFENLIREMVGEMDSRGPVTVYLHPDDLEALKVRMEARGGGKEESTIGEAEGNVLWASSSPPALLPSPLLTAEDYTLAADPSMGRGDCRIEAEEGTTLSQLAIQLDELRRQLLHGLGHAHA